MKKKLVLKGICNRIFILLVLIVSVSCSVKENKIMTVKGWIGASDMGITLAHEHILVDWIGADSTGYQRWNRDSVISRVLPYLKELKEYGCNTFIDCTPAYLGRDPFVDQRLSELSGLNIIISTGYYGAINDKYVPLHTWKETSEQLSERWLKEWNKGIDGSGIKPGIIKIAVRGDTVLSQLHTKIVEAAALTHLKSGLTIVSHTGPGERAFEQLEILNKHDVSPEAFVWTHAQAGTPEDHIRAAKSGAWISLDNVTDDTAKIQVYVEMLNNLKNNNLLNKVILSHDAGWYNVGQPGGGKFRSYTAIFTSLLPAMKKAGLTDEEINTIMGKNPQEAFSIKIRKI